ncbi:MAG: DUF255 domain-containing protein [Planctomycetota bacterium]
MKAFPTAEEIRRLPADGGPEFNRLIHEQSPYLREHARNPVDWYPWGKEAFQRAQDKGTPIFLSIGYSTCHWCHVMARESFESEKIAAVLNRDYVSVKVDREERPDIDTIFMKVTQVTTGHGGWPNSVWLTPDGRHYFVGTYFPPDDRQGRLGFLSILGHLSALWRGRVADVESHANRITEAARKVCAGAPDPGGGPVDEGWIDRALDELRESFDEVHGGFGAAPKFPPHGSLRLLLREGRRRGDDALLRIATETLAAMVRGGIHDHLGGGFHRYSTDRRWLLPHFEKMLYDNAQLARIHAEAFAATGEERFRETATSILAWVEREMTDPAGGFYSAIDADSEGEEGRFYVWRRKEILDALGEEDGGLFCRIYGIEEEGNFTEEATGLRPGTNVVHLQRPLDVDAKLEGVQLTELVARLGDARGRLLRIRDKRVRPVLDDKVLTSWNGLMIGALACSGSALEEPRHVRAAVRAAEFVLENLRRDGRLLRSWRGGSARLNGYLDDHAFLAEGLIELGEATGDHRWLAEARALVETLLERFHDEERGGFYFTSHDHEELLVRSRDPFDHALPSGNGVAAQVFLRLARHTGEERYREVARRTLEVFHQEISRAPRGTESLILAAALLLEEEGETGAGSPAGAAARGEPPPAADAEGRARAAHARAFAARLKVAPGGELAVAVEVRIEEGWHLGPPPGGAGGTQGVETRLGLDPAIQGPLRVERVEYPEAAERSIDEGDGQERVYEGTVWLRAILAADANTPPGAAHAALRLHLQCCGADRCLGEETIPLDLPVLIATDAAGAPLRHAGLFDSMK